MSQTVADCYRLGFGEPIAVSATTGEGLADLYAALRPALEATRVQLLRAHGGEGLTWAAQLHRKRPRSPAAVYQGGVTGGVAQPEQPQGGGAGVGNTSAPPQGGAEGAVQGERGEAELQAPQDEVQGAVRLAIMGLPNVVRALWDPKLACVWGNWNSATHLATCRLARWTGQVLFDGMLHGPKCSQTFHPKQPKHLWPGVAYLVSSK